MTFISSCTAPNECDECSCFNFVEPVRFSYLDEDNNDLLSNETIIIDSIRGVPIIDGEVSQIERNIDFQILNKVIEDSETSNYFCEMLEEFATMNNSGFIGIDVNHTLLIFRNSNVVDTLEFKWIEKIVEGQTCCTCTTFPFEYLKYNGETITEGSDSGAAIIRL